MKKSNFKINVSDLLLSAWKTDEISFEQQDIQNIKNLWPNKIKGNLLLQSFDQSSLLTTLENIECELIENCDKCLETYHRKVTIPQYQARYQCTIDPNEDKEDEIYPIDSDGNIDIEEMLINAIQLQTPFVHKCENCQKEGFEEEVFEEDEEENYDSDSFVWWTVEFR